MTKGFKWNVLICSCGNKTTMLRYKNGKKTCNKCNPNNLSGTFLRRMESEIQHYAKDVLQPGQNGFEELYGEGRNIRKM